MNYLDIARRTLESLKVGAESPIIAQSDAIQTEDSADELLDELARRGCLLGLDESGGLVLDDVPLDMAGAVMDHKAELTRILRIEAASMAEAIDATIDPPDPCQECGTLELWQTLAGNWRCLRCDPPIKAHRLRERAARLKPDAALRTILDK